MFFNYKGKKSIINKSIKIGENESETLLEKKKNPDYEILITKINSNGN